MKKFGIRLRLEIANPCDFEPPLRSFNRDVVFYLRDSGC
jgi:hypothetical protein